jgi:hypothetical protein
MEISRKHSIKLPADTQDPEIKRLGAALTARDEILHFQLDEQVLNVEYSFPSMTFHDIWMIIIGIVDGSRFTTALKWKYTFLSYRESNEQSHLLDRYGWQRHVTDIYVTHHHFAGHTSNKKKLWQNYMQSRKVKETGDGAARETK